MIRWMMILAMVVGLFRVEESQSIRLPSALHHVDLGQQGQSLASQPFQDERGRDVFVKDFKKLTLLKIWGTFCRPCVEEIKGLQRLREAFSERDLAIVPICIDNHDIQEVRSILDRHGGHNLPVFTNSALNFISTLGISGVPVSILVDEEGRELWRKVGGPTSWGHADVIQHFKDLLKAR